MHQKLKILREKKGISQGDVAEALHMAQNTYSRIETGKTKVNLELLYKFAEFYKIEPYDLVNSDGLTMNFNEKVENGYASYIQTVNADNKEMISALKEQLIIKDKQIEALLEILKKKKGNLL